MTRKSRIGFSVLDLVLVVLVAACILSTVFQDQIRGFLGTDSGENVEVTFLVEKVTEEARNHPEAGETVLLGENGAPLGTIRSVSEMKSVYASILNSEDEMEVLTLTCKMEAKATETELGYEIAGVTVKPGATFAVQTPSASFVMLVTVVKPIEND
ncbi:MAG: DUF4330 family protein [Clostridia bacterium]|nr:DUF4330 family protein [Clostridia bacterium]